ncbi:hypothetical protein RSAG8_12952, partial [Rhizoctonia solani AG-8 WAC10335]
MPDDYRHQASPAKHPHVIDKNIARECWIFASAAVMSPDPIHRPSLENGLIHRVNYPWYAAQAAPQDYRPPPPLIDPISHTASTGIIPHGAGPPSAITPVNPNYKIGVDLTHNSAPVAKGRPHDAVSIASIHVPPTPRGAIAHLDASHLQANDDQDSVVLRKRNRGRGMLSSMFGSHEPRASVEDGEPIHSNYAPEKERYGFRSLFSSTSREREMEEERGKEKEREREQTRHRGIENDRTQWEMSRLIGYATSTSVEDWSVVMEICDKVNLSDSEAKEASKALKKDIEFGRPAVQLSAAKLWAILMWNCSQYFIIHTTTRKFLGKIEEVVLSSTTSPVVRDRLVEVVGGSVYLLGDSKNLKPYQSTWKKLRLQLKLNHPLDGLEIPAGDPILNPTPHRPLSSLRYFPPNEHVQLDVVPNIVTVTQGLTRVAPEPAPLVERKNTRDGERRRDRVQNVESTYGLISPEENMRRLGRSHLLNLGSDALDLSTDESFHKSELPPALRSEKAQGKRRAEPPPEEEWSGHNRDNLDGIDYGNSRFPEVLLYDAAEERKQRTFEENDESTENTVQVQRGLAPLTEGSVTGPDSIPHSRVPPPNPKDSPILSNAVGRATENSSGTQSLSIFSSSPASAGDTFISRRMVTQEVVSNLVAHGCQDLSGTLDLSSFNEYPISHGGFSDIYRGQLRDGTKVAVKALRVSIDSINKDPKHLKVSLVHWFLLAAY